MRSARAAGSTPSQRDVHAREELPQAEGLPDVNRLFGGGPLRASGLVEVRWCAAARARRPPSKGASTVGERVDPITVSVIQHRLEAIVQEMGEAMLRTSYSQILNSSRDFSTALCDAEGRLVAQAEHVPIHVGAIPWAVRSVQEFFGDRVRPGDVYLLNDPYHGNNHLPDLTAFVPVFAPVGRTSMRPEAESVAAGKSNRPVFWSINRSHQSDIG